MTLLELKNIIDETIRVSPTPASKIIVGIPNNKRGVGGTSVTNVKLAYRGIDWDRSLFIIAPEEYMQEMRLKDKLKDL